MTSQPTLDYMMRSWSANRSPQTKWQVVALIKGKERFVFIYDEASREMMIDEIRYRAADPNSVINWQEAFQLIERIRRKESAGAQCDPDGSVPPCDPAQPGTPETPDRH